jgi:hypothetical protein
MKDITDNRNTQIDTSEIISSIKRLDVKSSIDRKIKFLLDVRGYYKVNQIKGSYVEFGSFDSKMHYAAYSILDKTNCFNNFIGLDTFEGEPKFEDIDIDNSFESEGDFNCNFQEVSDFVSSHFGSKGCLIKGDFREKNTINKIESKLKSSNINLSVIDCNLLSSFRSALEITLDKICSGGIIYLDDIFTNLSNGNPVIHDEFFKMVKYKKCKAIEHGFYAPFAKSYIIVR